MDNNTTTTPLHRRIHRVEQARRMYGDRIDRLAFWLDVCDPPADRLVEDLRDRPQGWGLFEQALNHGVASVKEAPESLKAFFTAVERVPAWVDWDRIERGGRTLLRTGFFGGITLGSSRWSMGIARLRA
ncbi:MAG: hypothetical protein AAFX99_32525, partial [Myxococcota bacterium]